MRARATSFGDFQCAHCLVIVSSAHMLSGVNNRNHCPYCLWSCHLDLFAAGDRLSACKAPMKPIGLTLKKSRNKYGREPRGELMLIHECVDCRTLSINRVAADDDSGNVMIIFETSLWLSDQVRVLCQEEGIVLLNMEDREKVRTQLFGHAMKIPAMSYT